MAVWRLVELSNGIYTPGGGFVRKKRFGFGPGGVEQLGMAVVFEVGFGSPAAEGKEDVVFLAAAPEFEVQAAGKSTNARAAFGEDGQEILYFCGAEGHFYDALERGHTGSFLRLNYDEFLMV